MAVFEELDGVGGIPALCSHLLHIEWWLCGYLWPVDSDRLAHLLRVGQQELLRSAISVLRGQESDNVLHVLPMEKARGGKWRQPPSGLVQETRTHHGP